MRKKKETWSAVRVSSDVVERGRKIRDLLLEKGDSVLPPRLRGRVEIPKDPYAIAVRKLGVGQVLDLALAALERELGGKSSS